MRDTGGGAAGAARHAAGQGARPLKTAEAGWGAAAGGGRLGPLGPRKQGCDVGHDPELGRWSMDCGDWVGDGSEAVTWARANWERARAWRGPGAIADPMGLE